MALWVEMLPAWLGMVFSKGTIRFDYPHLGISLIVWKANSISDIRLLHSRGNIFNIMKKVPLVPDGTSPVITRSENASIRSMFKHVCMSASHR